MAVPHSQGHQEMGTFECSGTDRLAHIEDISTLSPTSVPLSFPITAQSVPRLEKIAEAFQRIIFLTLTIRVVPQVSTATSGGYVAAFVSDVTDDIPPTENGLSKLTSQAGACTKKWWESASVRAALSHDLLYTSFSIQDPRLSSPGRFVLGVDGRATQRGSMTVFLDWKVRLSVPSLEGPETEESKIPVLQYELWTKAGEGDVWFLTKPGDYKTLTNDARKGIVNPIPNSYFRLSTPRSFVENSSNSPGQLISFNVIHIRENYQMVGYTSENKELSNLSFGHTMLAAAGENIEWKDKSPLSKNFHLGSPFLCHVPTWMPSQPSDKQSFPVSPPSSITETNQTTSLRSLLKECQTSQKPLDTEMLSAFQELLKDSFQEF